MKERVRCTLNILRTGNQVYFTHSLLQGHFLESSIFIPENVALTGLYVEQDVNCMSQSRLAIKNWKVDLNICKNWKKPCFADRMEWVKKNRLASAVADLHGMLLLGAAPIGDILEDEGEDALGEGDFAARRVAEGGAVSGPVLAAAGCCWLGGACTT